jgi:hypothetical protein
MTRCKWWLQHPQWVSGVQSDEERQVVHKMWMASEDFTWSKLLGNVPFPFRGHPVPTTLLPRGAVLVTRLTLTIWERWRVSEAVTVRLLTLPSGLLWSELMHHSLSQPDGKIQSLSKCVLMYVTGICKDCLINIYIWARLLS